MTPDELARCLDGHTFAGRCPDVTDYRRRDPDCPACQLLEELSKGGSMTKEAWMKAKIQKLIAEGKPQKQAVAIALSMWKQRQKGKK